MKSSKKKSRAPWVVALLQVVTACILLHDLWWTFGHWVGWAAAPNYNRWWPFMFPLVFLVFIVMVKFLDLSPARQRAVMSWVVGRESCLNPRNTTRGREGGIE